MSYLDANTISNITGLFHSGHWETFSDFSVVTVHRKPKEVYTSNNANHYYGYQRSSSNNDNVTLVTEKSGFNCIVRHKTDKQENQYMSDAHFTMIDGDLRIKVLEDTKDYIEASPIESFEIDNQFFNSKSEPFTQNFYGLRYYYYDLEKVK